MNAGLIRNLFLFATEQGTLLKLNEDGSKPKVIYSDYVPLSQGYLQLFAVSPVMFNQLEQAVNIFKSMAETQTCQENRVQLINAARAIEQTLKLATGEVKPG